MNRCQAEQQRCVEALQLATTPAAREYIVLGFLNWLMQEEILTHEEHKRRHMVLDEALRELWADCARHNKPKVKGFEDFTYPPQNYTVADLMQWSQAQTIAPTEDGETTVHSYSVCAHCGESVVEGEQHQCVVEQVPDDGRK